MQKRNFVRENHRWTSTGVGQVSGTLMTYLRRKAKERDLPFEVTADQLWELFNKQKGLCALSGVPITLTTVINKQNNLDKTLMSASLDRIDNSKGYYIDNVQWIHKTLNAMRRQYSIEEYVHWCTLVANHANPERSSVNEITVTENVQRLEGDDSTNKPSTSVRPQYVASYTGSYAVAKLMLGEDIV